MIFVLKIKINMNNLNLPVNHRKQWSDTENKHLLNEVKNKTPIHLIAEMHKRTIGAIKYKLIRNVIDDIEELRECELNFVYSDPPIEYLSEITNLSKRDLLEGFAKIKFDYYCEDQIENKNNDENSNQKNYDYINKFIKYGCFTLLACNLAFGIKYLYN